MKKLNARHSISRSLKIRYTYFALHLEVWQKLIISQAKNFFCEVICKSVDEYSLFRIDPKEELILAEPDSILRNTILTSAKTFLEKLTKLYLVS